jgi:hypothetical protein
MMWQFEQFDQLDCLEQHAHVFLNQVHLFLHLRHQTEHAYNWARTLSL